MKILLLITTRPFPQDAVALSGLLARLTRSPVDLLLVTLSEHDRQRAEIALERTRQMLAPVEVAVHYHEGGTTGRLVEEARRLPYDLVVLELRQIGYLRRMMMGSRIRAVVRGGDSSVLIAKNPPSALGRILICTGGLSLAEPVVDTGAQLAQAAGSQVTLLHVAGTVPRMYAGLAEIDESISELLDTDTPIARHLRRSAELLAEYQLEGKLKLRHGMVADEILREAAAGDYDLIVIGAPRPRGALHAWLLSDVSWNIVERAGCPVLVVKRTPDAFHAREEMD